MRHMAAISLHGMFTEDSRDSAGTYLGISRVYLGYVGYRLGIRWGR